MAFIIKLSEQYIQVYIPEMNICHDFRPFSHKLDSILKYNQEIDSLTITNTHTNKQIVFKLMNTLELLLVYFKFYPVDRQLSISIVTPNITDLIE